MRKTQNAEELVSPGRSDCPASGAEGAKTQNAAGPAPPARRRCPLRGGAATRSEPRWGWASLRPENAVARVAQARHDVTVLVQAAVHRRGVDRHVRVVVVEGLDALGAGHEADKTDRTRGGLLEPVHRRHR